MHRRVCWLLMVLLSLWEGLGAAPAPRVKPSDPRADFDAVINLAKTLLSDTKHLFTHFKSRFPAEGEHKMDTLPVLSMNAVELASIQVPGGLVRLSADLQSYQKHLDWLRKAGPVLRPLEPELGAVHNRLERLLRRLEHLTASGSEAEGTGEHRLSPCGHMRTGGPTRNLCMAALSPGRPSGA
ncbi:interleukin-11 [Alligator mississippiensis]|uniref:Interleukin-11 n=1 Tax=Alligator mississippiensis TaxID=8496 RepID=A0A151MG52_ALLMI|nr:interleukin-11 [Alligator mississippiensis]